MASWESAKAAAAAAAAAAEDAFADFDAVAFVVREVEMGVG